MPDFEGGRGDFVPHFVFVGGRDLVDVGVVKAEYVDLCEVVADEHEDGVDGEHEDWEAQEGADFVLNAEEGGVKPDIAGETQNEKHNSEGLRREK